MKVRVTQKDVATEAGVSRGTVSLALRNHPSIAKETRERIQEIARRINYVPDPELSRLAAYRMNKRPSAYHSNIGFITAKHLDILPHYSTYLSYFRGAAARLKELGYGMEEICLTDVNNSMVRLHSVLKAKGIRGIMLAPGEGFGMDELHLDLSSFAAVRFGYSYRYPLLHTIIESQFTTALMATEKAIAAGHRRIGIILNHSLHKRTFGFLLGGFRAAQEALPKAERLDPFFYDDYKTDTDRRRLLGWIRKSKLDCIIGCRNYHLLEEANLKVPEEVSYVELEVLPVPEDRDLSGVRIDHEQLGAAAADFLTGMLMRGETGIPRQPTHFKLDGSWVDGRSLAPMQKTV